MDNPERARRTMSTFQMALTTHGSLGVWLIQSMGTLHPPSRPSLHSASYLIHSLHPPLSILASLYSRYCYLQPLTLFLQCRWLSAMISYYFKVTSLSKKSCHTTDLILLAKHIPAILDCSSAASAPLCSFQEPRQDLVETSLAD